MLLGLGGKQRQFSTTTITSFMALATVFAFNADSVGVSANGAVKGSVGCVRVERDAVLVATCYCVAVEFGFALLFFLCHFFHR